MRSDRFSQNFAHLAIAATILLGAPAMAQDITEPYPPPPPVDLNAVEGGQAMDAASKALGPHAAEFVDRWVDGPPPFMIGSRDVWTAKFFTKPRVLKPGLCVERMLVIPLRLSHAPSGQATWQPFYVHWVDQARVVGRFETAPAAAADPKAEAACQDLGYYKSAFTYGLLQARSINQAWQAGLMLQKIAAAAEGRAKLPFTLDCRPAGNPVCRTPRQTLAGLMVTRLRSVEPCDEHDSASDCLRLQVGAPGDFGENYWELSVTSAGGDPAKATEVVMAFVVPPIM